MQTGRAPGLDWRWRAMLWKHTGGRCDSAALMHWGGSLRKRRSLASLRNLRWTKWRRPSTARDALAQTVSADGPVLRNPCSAAEHSSLQKLTVMTTVSV